MSTARAERLVNLVLALLSTRQYLTAERIRGIVPGYADAASDDAFFRTFERDKTELRELGIPLETGRNSAFDAIEGYRIARRDYELGEIDLAPDEAAAVALASRLWDSPELTGQAQGALVKLRAAGLEVDDQAPTVVEPRVRAEPAFGPLLAAVQSGQAVRFEYRRSGSPERIMRTLEPWGVVSWRARWYVVGHDRDRGATRCFRLSRVTGQVRAVGKPGEVRRPEGVNLLKLVTATGGSEPSPVTTAGSGSPTAAPPASAAAAPWSAAPPWTAKRAISWRSACSTPSRRRTGSARRVPTSSCSNRTCWPSRSRTGSKPSSPGR